ncbi:MAG: rRNA maturation RNase YbeY [Bifidobacteriaceae bacterium]|nr:rRNA maturation RNase YbeY [Bifidobacteriaceae bacterium]
MSVDIVNETRWVIDPSVFRELVLWTLERMRVSTKCDVSITFGNPDTLAWLHEHWMNLKGPTDVMSFPMDELRPSFKKKELPEGILGDIVLCPDVASRQAAAAGHSTVEEMMLLTIHGILHLLGYDHSAADLEEQMFMLQRQLMLTFLSVRPGDLEDVYLPEGEKDSLAQYEVEHPDE